MDGSVRVAGLARRREGAPAPSPIVPIVIYLAWVAAFLAQFGAQSDGHHHHVVIGGHVPVWTATGVFVLAWLGMVAAMMLPSSLPMLDHFRAVVRRQGRRRGEMARFVAAYFLVWTVFGVAAFVADVGVHGAVDRTPWLEAHEWVIAGAVLAIAGLFQFSSLKDRCLSQCRDPAAYLVRQRLRGGDGAFRLGVGHGLFCVGCCWALMLLMLAIGIASLVWMAVLTAVMVYEKVAVHGARIVRPLGLALIVWAGLVLAHPSWLPGQLAG